MGERTALLDEEEVARRLGLKRATLRMWRYLKKGPSFVRLGYRTIRYEKAVIEAYIAARTHCQEDGDAALPKG